MIILKNLTEAEHTFFSRINTLLKYKIAIGRVKTLKEAADYVLNKYFERLPEYGEWDEWEHREHVREVFTEQNLERAFQEVQFMDTEKKETFIFEIEGYHL